MLEHQEGKPQEREPRAGHFIGAGVKLEDNAVFTGDRTVMPVDHGSSPIVFAIRSTDSFVVADVMNISFICWSCRRIVRL